MKIAAVTVRLSSYALIVPPGALVVLDAIQSFMRLTYVVLYDCFGFSSASLSSFENHCSEVRTQRFAQTAPHFTLSLSLAFIHSGF